MTSRFTEFYEEKKALTPISGYWAYPLVSLQQSLSKVATQVNELDRSIQEAMKHCHFPSEHDLTRDESAAIFLYTMEAGEFSFYVVLNNVLRNENRKTVVPWFPFIKLFDTGLKKLPTIKGCIWRGVSRDVSHQYQKNEVLTWWTITSCSFEVQVVEDFLDSEKGSTLFMIEVINGRDISAYTLFPLEKEVILPMGTEFRVRSNAMKRGTLSVIHLVEVNDGIGEQLPTAMGTSSITPGSSTSTKSYCESFVRLFVSST